MNPTQTVQWKVEGMDCASCARTVHSYLEKQGLHQVQVNFATGEVQFEKPGDTREEPIRQGLASLGYQVLDRDRTAQTSGKAGWLGTHLRRFLFCLPFTAILLLPMIPLEGLQVLADNRLQLLLCLPVYGTGMAFFGRSALRSLRAGLPNMNVLIALGATAAFAYSLYGTLSGQPAAYRFYETAASIITLVFFGHFLEELAVRSTRRALEDLVRAQPVMANMIAFDDQHQEQIFPVESAHLRTGDLILVRAGEQVPADGKILWGEVTVNESILTGESVPVARKAKDLLLGGSVLVSGTARVQVTAVGEQTVLSGIIRLVRQVEGQKPPVQRLADRISAVFVPVVLGLAAMTLAANWLVLGSFTPALLRAVAVLVIACPCAMGLATPAAVAVGLGRGARNGVLFRQAASLELFRDIRQVVFDKTGTLTTGRFRITHYQVLEESPGVPVMEEAAFRQIAASLEKYSAHPVAACIHTEWKTRELAAWSRVEEIRGAGMQATDRQGNIYRAGSYAFAGEGIPDNGHRVYLSRNGRPLGWIDVADEIRPEAPAVVAWLRARGLHTVLLSGDRPEPCRQLASRLGIDEVFAGQSPEQKMTKVAELRAAAPTLMVGDGINDAPALACATIGMSLSEASQLAVQTAQVVLMNQGLRQLPLALGLGRHTYRTIRQNLFWAFAYNIIAIPVAALGWLSPGLGALAMGFSDVVLAINSVRLSVKRVI